MRLFIAVNFPEDVRAAIDTAMAPLRAAAPTVRWIPADRIHLTVKFLGEQPESAVQPLMAALTRVASGFAPIPMELAGLNAFPNLRAPRVVWLGVRADPKLELLHHEVEAVCTDLGYPLEGRAYRAHVTLGRVRDRIANAGRLASAARSIKHESHALAERVDLMVSEHVDGSPRYRVVGSAALSRE